MKNILATLKLVQSLCPPRSWLGWLVFVIFPPDSLENSFPCYWKQSQANLLADQVLAAELQARTETKTLIYSDWRNMIVTGWLPHIFLLLLRIGFQPRSCQRSLVTPLCYLLLCKTERIWEFLAGCPFFGMVGSSVIITLYVSTMANKFTMSALCLERSCLKK